MTDPATVTHYHIALPKAPAPLPAEQPRPRVLTTLPGQEPVVPVDTRGQSNADGKPDTAPAIPLGGSFSAVRAARIAHQYRVGFWDPATGIVDKIANTNENEADPNPDDIDAQYEDFLLFCYLPVQLQPTKEQFSDLISPTRRSAYVARSVTAVGVAGDTGVAPASLSDLGTTANPLLPTVNPFASRVSAFCADPFFELAL